MHPGLYKLVDMAFTLALAGLERQPIVDHVRKREEEGATPDQITDELQAMRQGSEADAQRKIDEAPE